MLQHQVDQIFFFIHLEGIGKTDSFERLVGSTNDAMVDRFDVDGCDVIRQQDNLICVYFVAVLVCHLFGVNQTTLHQSGNKCSSSGEGVDDVHPFAPQRLVKLFFQDVIDAVDNEVDHFHGSIDNTQLLRHLRERVTEKFIVQLNNDLLFSRSIVDSLGTHFYTVVKRLEIVCFLVQVMFVENI